MGKLVTRMFVGLLLALLITNSAGAVSASNELASRLDRSHNRALVIGISKYDNFAQLPWVDEEVRRVSAAFSDAGFSIEIPPNLSPDPANAGRMDLATLRTVVADFVRRNGSDPENRLVIYFASHGWSSTTPENKGTGYLLASDTRGGGEIASSAYSVDDLASALSAVQSKQVFVFVNACFSGSMYALMNRGAKGIGQPDKSAPQDVRSEWLNSLLSKKAWLFLSAGTDSQPVPDANNPFALSIAAGLAGAADLDGDGYILGIELAMHVRKAVSEATIRNGRRNDPFFASLDPTPGDPEGEFVFRSPAGPRSSATNVVSVEETLVAARNEKLSVANSFSDCSNCPVMVKVAGEQNPLALARTELTYMEWDACYRELGCERYMEDDGKGRGNRPVGGITWKDQLQYVAWLNGKKSQQCERYRLPTGEEWLAAAAGGPDWKYPWGEAFIEGKADCWGCGKGGDGQAAVEVASFPENVHGLFDMAGSLWEWTDSAGDCDAKSFLLGDRSCSPGTVMGGSFATRWSDLDVRTKSARAPRTSAPRVGDTSGAWSLETIGLRVACELKQ